MAYQVYFANMAEENQSLLLAVLRLKEEVASVPGWPTIQKLQADETELLMRLRGPIPAGSFQYQEISDYEDRAAQPLRRGRGRGGRRPSERPRGNGRSSIQ